MRISAPLTAPIFVMLLTYPALAGDPKAASTADHPPRKMIVGTAMQAFWGEYPGLTNRLQQLTGLVDLMAEESQLRGDDYTIKPNCLSRTIAASRDT